jgi:hypothetical protein
MLSSSELVEYSSHIAALMSIHLGARQCEEENIPRAFDFMSAGPDNHQKKIGKKEIFDICGNKLYWDGMDYFLKIMLKRDPVYLGRCMARQKILIAEPVRRGKSYLFRSEALRSSQRFDYIIIHEKHRTVGISKCRALLVGHPSKNNKPGFEKEILVPIDEFRVTRL